MSHLRSIFVRLNGVVDNSIARNAPRIEVTKLWSSSLDLGALH
jgi:hypothetical protein